VPRLRTDDGPRKLRAVWLGPKGATLPFQWTYVQWLVTLVSVPVVVTVLWVLLNAAGVQYAGTWAVPWGTAAAMYASVKVMRHVSYDEPLRHLQQTVRSEWRQSTRATMDRSVVAFDFPPITYLAQPTLRAMGWTGAGQRPLPNVGPSNATHLMDEPAADGRSNDISSGPTADDGGNGGSRDAEYWRRTPTGGD
jgi:hypothetical protein